MIGGRQNRLDLNPDGPLHYFHKTFVATVSSLLADVGVPDKTRPQDYQEVGSRVGSAYLGTRKLCVR